MPEASHPSSVLIFVSLLDLGLPLALLLQESEVRLAVPTGVLLGRRGVVERVGGEETFCNLVIKSQSFGGSVLLGHELLTCFLVI